MKPERVLAKLFNEWTQDCLQKESAHAILKHIEEWIRRWHEEEEPKPVKK